MKRINNIGLSLICLFLCISLYACQSEEDEAINVINEIEGVDSCEIVSSSSYEYDFTSESVEDIVTTVILTYTDDTSQVSYFYEWTGDHDVILYNEETEVLAASTYKVPLNMLYYDMIDNGELSENSLLYYSSESYSAYAYISSNYAIGSSIELSTLQYSSIVYSDNTASLILLNNYGVIEAYDEMYQKYAQMSFDDDFYYNNETTALAGYYIIQYLYENENNYAQLIENMKNATEGEFLQATTNDYEIAHKYGDYGGYTHDYGIVYTDEPYLVGIYTNQVANSSELISEINNVFLNYTLWKQENSSCS